METTFDPTNINGGIGSTEYQWIGVVAPMKTVGDSLESNRTLYMPQYMETMAYHADGTDARVELELYIDSVVSGGTASFGLDASDSGGNPNLLSLTPTELFDPYCSTEMYSHDNTNPQIFFGGGLHAISALVKGDKRVVLYDQFSNLQGGAFKNYAVKGGTYMTQIGMITPGTTTAITFSEFSRHREGETITIRNVSGTMSTVLNDNVFYPKVTGFNTVELYHDILFTQPVDTTGLTHDMGTGISMGEYGDQMYFVVVAKPIGPSATAAHGDITIHFNIGWTEINQ